MPTGVFPTFARELWRAVRLRAFLIPFVFIFLFFSVSDSDFFSSLALLVGASPKLRRRLSKSLLLPVMLLLLPPWMLMLTR
jgi:hypothetical protein